MLVPMGVLAALVYLLVVLARRKGRRAAFSEMSAREDDDAPSGHGGAAVGGPCGITFLKKAVIPLAGSEWVSLWDDDKSGTVTRQEGSICFRGTRRLSLIASFFSTGVLGRLLIRPSLEKSRTCEVRLDRIQRLVVGQTWTGKTVYHLFQTRPGGAIEVHVFRTIAGTDGAALEKLLTPEAARAPQAQPEKCDSSQIYAPRAHTGTPALSAAPERRQVLRAVTAQVKRNRTILGLIWLLNLSIHVGRIASHSSPGGASNFIVLVTIAMCICSGITAKSLGRSTIGWVLGSIFTAGLAPIALLFLQPAVSALLFLQPAVPSSATRSDSTKAKESGARPSASVSDSEVGAAVASGDAFHAGLPTIPTSYLQHRSCKFVAKIVSVEGDKYDKEAVQHWNNNRFDECQECTQKALNFGLGEHEQAYAHNTLGQIYIQKRQLMKAVESLLKCLSLPNRPDEPTFGAAVRLHVIYGAVGRKEATELLRLAEASNSKGWRFAGAVQLENLAREQVGA
jgi:hypothetical protein